MNIKFKVLGLPDPTTEYKFHPKRRWRFDFAWIDRRIALEVEGGVWQYGRHNRSTGFLKDLEKYNEAAVLGWTVLRVTPEQLLSGEAATLVKRCVSRLDSESGNSE